jgi:hypothetical protein
LRPVSELKSFMGRASGLAAPGCKAKTGPPIDEVPGTRAAGAPPI